MNIRAPLAIAGLILPVVLLALLTKCNHHPVLPDGKEPVNDNKQFWVPLKENATPIPAIPPKLTDEQPLLPGPDTDGGTTAMYQSEVERVQIRLDKLDKMTEEDFAEDQKKRGAVTPPGTTPLTLDRARDRTRKRLFQLKGMTPEMWADEQRDRFKAGIGVDKLTPDQRHIMEQQLKKEEMQKGKGEKPSNAPPNQP